MNDARHALQALAATEQPAVLRVDPGDSLDSRVAVLPASFNPPTVAHVELLERAREVEGVASSAALLTTRNVDKGVFGAGHQHRLAMLLALRLPATGILLSNAARIADQAAVLRDAFPSHQFDFVVGYDTLVRLFDERYYEGDMHSVLEPYFAHHRLIAATRDTYDLEAIERYREGDTHARRYGDRILPLELGPEVVRVSSSAVRQRAGSVERLEVPDAVESYIREHRLYRGSD